MTVLVMVPVDATVLRVIVAGSRQYEVSFATLRFETTGDLVFAFEGYLTEVDGEPSAPSRWEIIPSDSYPGGIADRYRSALVAELHLAADAVGLPGA